MLKYNDLKIEKFNHDTLLIQDGFVFYIDPWQIDMMNMPRADFVLISHHHHDHCSPDDIEKIIKSNTVIIASVNCKNLLQRFQQDKIFLEPGQSLDLQDSIKVQATFAYNINKFRAPGQLFHPKEEKGIGFVIDFPETRLYFAGDTDLVPEMEQLKKIDIAFLPISGTYVMDKNEAKEAIAKISPKMVIPIHYGSIIGDRKQAEELRNEVEDSEIIILD